MTIRLLLGLLCVCTVSCGESEKQKTAASEQQPSLAELEAVYGPRPDPRAESRRVFQKLLRECKTTTISDVEIGNDGMWEWRAKFRSGTWASEWEFQYDRRMIFVTDLPAQASVWISVNKDSLLTVANPAEWEREVGLPSPIPRAQRK